MMEIPSGKPLSRGALVGQLAGVATVSSTAGFVAFGVHNNITILYCLAVLRLFTLLYCMLYLKYIQAVPLPSPDQEVPQPLAVGCPCSFRHFVVCLAIGGS